MNKLITIILTGLATSIISISANAALIDVSGPLSSLGGSAQIITAPSDISDDAATNNAQQGFNEVQNHMLIGNLAIDNGSIASGTTVDSHMIFLNTENNLLGEQFGVEWTFSGTILGVMSDYYGNLETDSNSFLGASGTTYDSNFAARGLEGTLANCDMNAQDCYSISGNTLTLTMRVSEPGDWIRVITQSTAQVPEPSTLLIFSLGLIGLGFTTKKLNNNNTHCTLNA